jgi:hypothetical protein
MVRFQHGGDNHQQQKRSCWMRIMWSIMSLSVLLALTTTQTEQSLFIVQHKPRAATTTTTIPNDYETTIGAPAGEITSGGTATTTYHQDDGRSSATGGGGVVVGSSGGAWTAETHLTQYGFNVDAGLVRVLEASCRDVENARNDGTSQWSRHPSLDSPIGGLWRPPAIVDCRVLELGSGVGVYVDALKKDQAKTNRQVFGMEPNRMGGVYERRNGPRQLLVDIMATTDPVALAKSVLRDQLKKTNGNDDDDGGGSGFFDLLYSIEVCEHMPPDRHEDAAVFLATLARPGTKLIFGAASPGQGGTGHIGNRKKSEWESILGNVGFVKHEQETLAVAHELDEYNHKVNTQVYYYKPSVTGTSRR